MPVPVSQMWTVASYVLRQKLAGRKQYPLVLMLEPLFRCNLACAGCGKIQYPAHILKKDLSPGRMLPRRRRMRRPHGLDPRRRTAHAPADRQDRRGPGRPQEIHLSLHQRAAAEREDPSLQAQQVPDVQRPPRRPARRARPRRLPRRRIRHRRRRRQRSPAPRLPRHHQHHAVRRRQSEIRPRLLRRDDGPGRRGHDALPGILLRQGSRPEAFPRTRPHPPHVPRDPVEPQEELAVQPVAACSSNS